MAARHTTSVNIIRDKGKELNYIPTPNANRIVSQISNDFKKGLRAYNVIGSYGTGKSSFLWAFQECLENNKKYFGVNLLPSPTVEFINIVGESKSLIQTFAETFGVSSNKNIVNNIFSEVYNRYHDLGKKNPILFIVLDEFGKFLEYAVQNEPEKELYFIQQLAEFVSNPDYNIVLFTTVHQNFDAYALTLSLAQKQEWTKVKGRFKEITFNEPVEQLLFLASEHLPLSTSKNKYEKDVSSIIGLLVKSKAFNINEEYIKEIAIKLFPLDIFASYLLTLSLQKYGQNERSLFSFLESTDHTGLFQHKQTKDGFYSIADLYDYLIFNFHSYLNSIYNPDIASWNSIRIGLEKVETNFDRNTSDYFKIVKAIGLLNIFAQTGANLDKSYLITYASKCLLVKNPDEIIDELEKRKIIFYRTYHKRFVLFEGTELDIQLALVEAGRKVDDVTDVVTLLNKYYQLPPIVAKKVMYETGTPRLFEYRISSQPIKEIPEGEIDGFINLIFNEKEILKDVKSVSAQNEEAVIYCYYKNSKSIKELLFEIEKTKKVINENEDDKVAVRELANIILHQQNLLTHKILNNFNGPKSDVLWIFKGEVIDIKSRKTFNSFLSNICDDVYSKTPIFNNELVNKHKISKTIHTAKRNYFRALINDWDKPQLAFPADKFPPEKTIYLSLLETNNIVLFNDDINSEIKPSSKNRFNHLWKYSLKFLESAKTSRRSIAEFIDLLNQRPFKLKQGLIDFWVPSFLFLKRDDFALFNNNVYIPFITDEVLDLMGKNPHEFEVKCFAIEGVKLDIFNSYRILLNQNSKDKLSNSNFIETIKPFLTFYKDLPEYSRYTNRLSNEAQAIRFAISNSKDPEKTFFEDFPNALKVSISDLQHSDKNLQKYILKLQDTIRELRTSYDELVNRFENFIQTDVIGETILFEEYKLSLQQRYKKLRRHLLLPNQRNFILRLDSQIEDKKAWLNSLVQCLVNKTLDKIKDEEEVLVCDSFKAMILELDSLTNLSKSDFKEDKEDVFDLQINSFFDGISKKIVRLPKNKKAEVNTIQEDLKKKLSKDKTLNIAALTNLLKEMLKHE
ncbi:MAG: hypothetical protein K9H61_06805 [Bacteroidia bacterium]|nr:hypothetical protein [Bacteroidia bacterium]MCF8446688.1 hypothetical protein [Bacteroidia bacterium]